MSPTKKSYIVEYWAEIDRRVFEPHEYAKITHCRDCHKEGRRRFMRKKRNPHLDPTIALPAHRRRSTA